MLINGAASCWPCVTRPSPPGSGTADPGGVGALARTRTGRDSAGGCFKGCAHGPALTPLSAENAGADISRCLVTGTPPGILAAFFAFPKQ